MSFSDCYFNLQAADFGGFDNKMFSEGIITALLIPSCIAFSDMFKQAKSFIVMTSTV